MGEPSLFGFGRVVFQREAKAGKSCRRRSRFIASQREMPGVEQSPFCGVV
jgi:hypothetical protein